MAKIWNRNCFDFKCEKCNGIVGFTQKEKEIIFEVHCLNMCCQQKYRIHMDIEEAVPFGEQNPSKISHAVSVKRFKQIQKEESEKQYDCLNKRL